MVRLSNYVGSSAEVLPEFLQAEAFAKFSTAIGKVIEAQEDMAVDGLVALYSSLLTFTLQVHPDRLDYVDQILGACVKKLSGRGKPEDSKAKRQIVALLSGPLEKYKDIDTVLKLTNYPQMMEYLDYATKREMTNVIIQSIMKNKTCISTSEKVMSLFFKKKSTIAIGNMEKSATVQVMIDSSDDEDTIDSGNGNQTVESAPSLKKVKRESSFKRKEVRKKVKVLVVLK